MWFSLFAVLLLVLVHRRSSTPGTAEMARSTIYERSTVFTIRSTVFIFNIFWSIRTLFCFFCRDLSNTERRSGTGFNGYSPFSSCLQLYGLPYDLLCCCSHPLYQGGDVRLVGLLHQRGPVVLPAPSKDVKQEMNHGSNQDIKQNRKCQQVEWVELSLKVGIEGATYIAKNSRGELDRHNIQRIS